MITGRSWALDSTGVCHDCKELSPVKNESTALVSDVKKITSTLDVNFSIVEEKKSMLHWKCDVYQRKLFLTDKSEKIDSHFLVQSYSDTNECIKDEMLLNQSPTIVQDNHGRRTLYPVVVCFNDNYYLVNQDIGLNEISVKGKKLATRYMPSSNTCAEIPKEYSILSLVSSATVLLKADRYQELNRKLDEHHQKVLEHKFR